MKLKKANYTILTGFKKVIARRRQWVQRCRILVSKKI
jgi:hypothetical protein